MIIDFDDTLKVLSKKWTINSLGYLFSTKAPRVLLHRFIMNAKLGEVVDHINGNKLDNRKCNLRICTRKQNTRNRVSPKKKNSSIFKGVSFKKSTKRWGAYIKVNYKQIFLGYYNSEVEAALIYNMAAIKYFGKFAKLNKIIHG